jgi:hypothetical protein
MREVKVARAPMKEIGVAELKQVGGGLSYWIGPPSSWFVSPPLRFGPPANPQNASTSLSNEVNHALRR